MDYRSIIESRYNRENWQKLLHHIFNGREKFWNTPSPVNTSSRFAKQVLWLGTITLSDEQTIAVYEVELADSVDIERNRRGIRDMLLSEWRGNGNAGAFMFCYRKNESVLRFSYVSEAWTFAADGSYQKESTDAKRFTYLLGEGHRSRTAIQQFEKLKESSLNLEALTKAFSVDAVSDMFFKEYKKNYEDIIFYVTGKRMVKVSNKWEERREGEPCEEIMQEFAHFPNPEKAVRDYVKKLMGRLVFLQFLQKKGWLGVRAGQPWGSGDGEFVQHLFADCRDKDHFVDNVLEALFNDLDSEDEIAMPQYRTPYLNGGLFERDASDESNFPLPAKYMQQLLDFYSSYNFTIDENDPDDAEVGVDPEMLGRIFENLLEDNKDKGAFYTPKEIVTYMCRESLIAYLQTDIDDEASKEAIRKFVTTHDANLLGDITNDVDQRLKDVKICDPAIGSGAFPMGLLKELFQCRSAIEGFDQSTAAEIKKHIIQNNIYGVDIEKGAVDIARLRFWLSLIVDEETPQALPNLDFKIMRGNSLFEKYNGFDLSTIMHTKKKVEGPVQMTFFEDDVDVLRRQVIALRRKYYRETDKAEKKNLRHRMREIVQQQINALSYNIDLSGIDIADNSEFFLWHTWFADVFEKGGFDIVIANPPYVDAKKLKGIAPSLKSYSFYNGSADLYTYFYELGLNIIAKRGVLTFITSNKWVRSEYGRNLRKAFVKLNILQLIDFGRNRLFGATVDSNILVIKKEEKKNPPLLYYFDDKTIGRNLLEILNNSRVDDIQLTEEAWLLKAGENELLRNKMEKIGVPLKNFDVHIYRGILTGFNKAYHIVTSEKEKLVSLDANNAKIIKPLICGSDTTKYYCRPNDLWIINVHNGIKGTELRPINVENYPAIKERLDGFYQILSERTDKGCTPYNLRNCAYLKEFNKEKIIWQAISKRIAFAYDPKGSFYCDVTTYFMTGGNLKYLLAIMNSKLFEYSLLNIYLEGDTFKSKNAIIQNFPIPNSNYDLMRKLEDIVDVIINIKEKSPLVDTSSYEFEIDKLVYQLYGLGEAEIRMIEGV